MFKLIKIMKKLVKGMVLILIFPLTLLIFRAFKLVGNFKVAIIRADRLGHLALNTDLFFRRIQLGLIPCECSYYLIAPSQTSKLVANRYLLKMFKRFAKEKRNVRIITSSIAYFFTITMKRYIKKYNYIHELDYKSNEKEFSISNQSIEFTNEEIVFGNAELQRLGIHDNKQKIVCIYARDSTYLNSVDDITNWKYHDYRNVDVNTYIMAIKYLISKGYKVIRIGSVVDEAVWFIDKSFYDYSVSGNRTEFLDLYLVSISEFIIGSSSGATDIAEVFKTPFLAVNFAPCIGAPLGKYDLYIPKKYVDMNNNESVIPFKDILKIDSDILYQGDLLEKIHGITYLDNTPEEILVATVEMQERISGAFLENANDKNLQSKYFNEFWSINPKAGVQTAIGREWLKNNQSLYF
jgi:putative glycosyltransferase (TIGR04372 family)